MQTNAPLTAEQRRKLIKQRFRNVNPNVVVPIHKMEGRTTLHLEKEVRLRSALNQPPFRMSRFVFYHTSKRGLIPTMTHLATFHNVKVMVKTASLDEEAHLHEIIEGMRIIINAFRDDPRPKTINDVYRPWLLDMIVDSTINELDYINIEQMDNISPVASRWLADHAKTVQLLQCTFADSGLAFCKRLNAPSCKVHTIKFLSTSIVGRALGAAIAKSKTLVSLNIQDKREFIGDQFWTDVIEALSANTMIESVFLSGHYRDPGALEKDFVTALSCKRDRKFSIFLSLHDAPSQASQIKSSKAIWKALRNSRHLITMNYPGIVVDINDWSDKMKPLIQRNDMLWKLKDTVRSIQHNAKASMKMFGKLVEQEKVVNSPDAIFHLLCSNFIYIDIGINNP